MKKNIYLIIISFLAIILIIVVLLISFKKGNVVFGREMKIECESANSIYVDNCESVNVMVLKIKNNKVLSSQPMSKIKCSDKSNYYNLKEKFYAYHIFDYNDENLIISHSLEEETIYSTDDIISYDEYIKNVLKDEYKCNAE